MSRALLGLAGALALVQVGRFAGAPYVLDDAWISASIADNLVTHGAPTYTLGAAPVEGMTNGACTLSLAAWIAWFPGVDPIAIARVVGALLWLLAIAVLARAAARRVAPDAKLRAAAVTTVVLAASGSAAFHAGAGLETGGWALLGALAIDAFVAIGEKNPRAELHLGLVAAAMVTWRPEGVLLGGAFVAAALWRRRTWATWVATALPWACAVAAVTAIRWHVYGALVPNTFHAKPPDPFAGLSDLGLFVGYGLGGVGLLALTTARWSGRARALVLIATVMVAGTVWSGGDWMPGYRRFTFAYLVVAWALGVAAVASTNVTRRRLACVGVVGCLLGNAVAAARSLDHGAYSPYAMADLAARCNATPGVDTVALVDIGRFGWHFDGRVVDLAGLTDAEIAAVPGHHLDKFDGAIFDARDADLAFVFVDTDAPGDAPWSSGPIHIRTPVEARLRAHLDASSHWRLHGFVRYGARTWIAVFARNELALSPSIWGPRWSSSDPRG